MFQHKTKHVAQFFKGVIADSIIPVQDIYAYPLYPQYQWLYNKLILSRLQGLDAQPHGITPHSFPVFSKPIYNLEGMSIGAKVLHQWSDEEYQAGHFWMPFLEGQQLSTDIAILDGKLRWACSFQPVMKDNSFDHWILVETPSQLLKIFCDWIAQYLTDFCGIINCETISQYIIECHLRMSTQFIDLYGPGWLKKVALLYDEQIWKPHHIPEEGYSVVLRTSKAGIYRLDPQILHHLRKQVSSIQICFEEDRNVTTQRIDNDDYTYRLAIINDYDLQKCLEVREQLVKALLSKRQLEHGAST